MAKKKKDYSREILERIVGSKRKTDLAKVGIRAMFGGAIASWLTATMAGILL